MTAEEFDKTFPENYDTMTPEQEEQARDAAIQAYCGEQCEKRMDATVAECTQHGCPFWPWRLGDPKG